jgi:uncharacterized protein YkwD
MFHDHSSKDTAAPPALSQFILYLIWGWRECGAIRQEGNGLTTSHAMKNAIRPFAFTLVLIIATATLGQAQPLRAVDIAAEERSAEMLIAERINAERTRLAPDNPTLASDPALTKIARLRSQAMALGAPFAHEDENGRFAAGDLVHKDFGPYGAVGENIMMQRDESRAFDAEAFARRAVAGWISSEGHRANILSRNFNRSGVGVVVNGSYVYATQVFWGPPVRPAGRGRRGP